MSTVYSYYLPEVRAIVDELAREFPHQTLANNVHPGLDELHEPLLERFVEHAAAQGVRGFEELPSRYVTSGSSEGIFHLLAAHAAHHPGQPLYQLTGEYQGYGAYADSLGIEVRTLEVNQALDGALPPGLLALSQPSARDGNRLPAELVSALLDRHRTLLDFAYLGMTEALDVDVAHPNVVGIVTSLSKPLGLYYLRIGFCATRQPLASLYATKWFKNAFSILVGQHALERLDHAALRDRYRRLQARALAAAADDLGVEGLRAADVWLLANADARTLATHPQLQPFVRGDGARLCLTPYLMAMEADGA